MNRSQWHVAILMVLSIMMIAVYARALHPAGPREPHPPAPPQDAPKAQTSNTVLPLAASSRDAQRQRLAELKWSRDPFTPGMGIGQISGLALSGILWDATQPIAIINGMMVHVGQEVEGYRVVDITQDHVSLSDGVETFQLRTAP